LSPLLPFYIVQWQLSLSLCTSSLQVLVFLHAVFLGYSEDRGRTPVLTDLADLELLEQFFTHKQVKVW